MKITIHSSIVFLLFIFGCQLSNNTENTRDSDVTGTSIANNTIINLYDAFGKNINGLTKDFGFSALVNYNGKLILFDAGTNADILKKNVETLGIDLSQVDIAIGSHAHGDHLNGFDYLIEMNPDVRIYLPFDFYAGAKIQFNIEGQQKSVIDSLPDQMKYFGGKKEDLNIIINQSGRFRHANVTYIKKDTEIEPGIKLISTRSPYLGYASKYPTVAELEALGNSGSTKNESIQFTGMPELSLGLATNNGEVLIVGCSHSSVQNIIKETLAYSEDTIYLLYGGYHTLPYNRNEINTIASQLENELKVEKLAPAHCTGHLAFKILKDTYGDDYLFAGLGEIIHF